MLPENRPCQKYMGGLSSNLGEGGNDQPLLGRHSHSFTLDFIESYRQYGGIARACDVYEICLIFILSTAFVSSFGIGVGHPVELSEFLYLFR